MFCININNNTGVSNIYRAWCISRLLCVDKCNPASEFNIYWLSGVYLFKRNYYYNAEYSYNFRR